MRGFLGVPYVWLLRPSLPAFLDHYGHAGRASAKLPLLRQVGQCDNLLCALLAWLFTISCHYRVATGRGDTRGGSISTLVSAVLLLFFSGQIGILNFRSGILKVVILSAFLSCSLRFCGCHRSSFHRTVPGTVPMWRPGLRCHDEYTKGRNYIRRSCLGGDLFECLGLQEFFAFDARQALTAVNAPPRDHDYAAAPAQASKTLGYGVRVRRLLQYDASPFSSKCKFAGSCWNGSFKRQRKPHSSNCFCWPFRQQHAFFSFCLLLFFACSALAAKLAAAGAAAAEGAGVENGVAAAMAAVVAAASMLYPQRFQTAFGSTARLALNFFTIGFMQNNLIHFFKYDELHASCVY